VNVLVTGASGFLGRYVVVALRNAGHRVRALVRPATSTELLNWPPDIEIFRADLCVADDLVAAFDGIDVLVHLAAQVRGNDQTRVSATLTATERLLNAMAVSTTKRLVLASSFSVYDYRELRGTLAERDPVESTDLMERDSYAIAKVDQERMVRRFAQQHSWELTVLRPGAIWGSGHLDLPNLGLRLGPFYFIIAPRATLPLSYVENCADAFTKAATAPGGQTLNVVDDELVTAWSFAGEYIRRTKQAVIRVPVPYRLGLLAGHLVGVVQRTFFRGKLPLPNILRPRCYEARFKPLRYSNHALRESLNWRPRFSFRQAWDRALRTAPMEASRA
jgi:UDP-glucose 4-epimerase